MKKPYWTIVTETAFDTFYEVFDSEPLYRYSINEKVDYDDAMVKEAFTNEEAKRLSQSNPYPRVPYTESDIRQQFQDNKIVRRELSRVLGSKQCFFDLPSYTQWLMDNSSSVTIVETHEGISP